MHMYPLGNTTVHICEKACTWCWTYHCLLVCVWQLHLHTCLSVGRARDWRESFTNCRQFFILWLCEVLYQATHQTYNEIPRSLLGWPAYGIPYITWLSGHWISYGGETYHPFPYHQEHVDHKGCWAKDLQPHNCTQTRYWMAARVLTLPDDSAAAGWYTWWCLPRVEWSVNTTATKPSHDTQWEWKGGEWRNEVKGCRWSEGVK